MFPERFSNLDTPTWPRLRALLDAHAPGGEVVNMTIGEPKHAFPDWVPAVIADNAAEFGRYPTNEGTPELLSAVSGWLRNRFSIDVPNDQILALNGTREGLYNAAMALCPERKSDQQPVVLIPNPFYQVYMIGALSVGAEPCYLNATAANGFLPDFHAIPSEVLSRTALALICSPSNPEGAVADESYLRDLIALAEEHDFQILSDECYSEIYRDEAPLSALQVARDMGADPERVVIFHSLSKRSNLPGLRSGFAAGGPESIRRMRELRAFAGAPLPMPLQRVAERAWADETHVRENRALYARKYATADRILGNVPGYRSPDAGFFLWLPVDDGETAALKLWTEAGVRVLPGAYLSQDTKTGNPGKGYIRVALVAPEAEMANGLERLRDCLWPNS